MTPLSTVQGRMDLLVKTSGTTSVAHRLGRLVAERDPVLPALRQQTMAEQTGMSRFPQRVALYVAGGLGGVAVLLALLGIYGVTAFSVAQRTREIGVRVALGTHQWSALGLILRQGMVLAGIGVTVGALAAFGVTRLIGNLLYGVPPRDIVAFGTAAALLACAALTASWVPARRAARVDAMIALRSE